MKLQTKLILLLPVLASLFFCLTSSAAAQKNPFDDISDGASVFVFRKNYGSDRDAVGRPSPSDAAGKIASQKSKRFERRRVVKPNKTAAVSQAPQKIRKPTVVLPVKPDAPEVWVNESADLAIEERKNADEEPLLFLSEGYLNSKIQFCESPLFPEDSRAGKLKQVRQMISVTIGKYGGVLDAQSLEGDPVFRESVYRSFESMRFRESYFMGKPVRIQGVLDLTQKPTNDVLCRVAGKEAEIPAMIEGGVLNEFANGCDVPAFPTDATNAGLKTVAARIQVIVDEKGNVANARVVDGHPAFGEAALKAALQSKFPASSIIKQPVKVRGFLIFTQTPNNGATCKSVAVES